MLVDDDDPFLRARNNLCVELGRLSQHALSGMASFLAAVQARGIHDDDEGEENGCGDGQDCDANRRLVPLRPATDHMNPPEDEWRDSDERHQVAGQDPAGPVAPQDSKRSTDLVDRRRPKTEDRDPQRREHHLGDGRP